MTLYVLRRLATGLVLAVLVTFITFLLLSPSFDDIVANKLGPAGSTPEAVAQAKAELGLDRPLVIQYLDWLGDVVRGDFGVSYFTSQPVADAVTSRLAVTLSVVLVALGISLVISVVLGVLAAYRGGVVDRVVQSVSLIGHLVPSLLIAIGLVYLLSVQLGWLPATGYTRLSDDPVGWLKSITIPVIALVVGGIANLTAQIRGAMVDELHKDYVRTLRTRGIGIRPILLRHVLRNAAGPALTVLSLEFLTMLGGALIIENVFALPGYGQFAFASSLQGDIPVIMGITAFGVILLITVNLVTDLINGWLNPKARVL
ncbi:ABC transporter permease [Blastococcus sp. SYSU D00813]